MVAIRAPSREDIKILGELSAGTLLREEQILSKVPEWTRLEQKNVLQRGGAGLLRSLHDMTLTERANAVKHNSEIPRALLKVLSHRDDFGPLQYILTLFYDLIRDDTSVTDALLGSLKGTDVYGPFRRLQETRGVDSYTNDKAAFLFSSLTSHDGQSFCDEQQVKQFVVLAMSSQVEMSEAGRLDMLKNFMKNSLYRHFCWDAPGTSDLIINNLDHTKVSGVYPAMFCGWLMTFHQDLIPPFTRGGGVERVCKVVKSSKTEKVVRLCINTLMNCLKDDAAVEVIIRQDAVQTLTVLEYEKWRDEELAKDIANGLAALQQKIKQFRNFDRYCRELESGKLSWSFLHSEKFWHENFMEFETNEFAAVKALVRLLRSSDTTTLAVVCYDLGEFARLHPIGKKTLTKLKAKELVMTLMSHKERDVSREALLCVQKMMLERWQAAAGER